jgi:hypothetical protein
MNKLFLLAGLTLLLGACATTRTATAEEVAQCRAMASQMGLGTAHDHGAMKRNSGQGAMKLSHKRCQRILQAQENQPAS